MSLKHKVLDGAVWAVSAQAISMFCNFLLTLVLAHGLSPADYGLYFVALSTVVIGVNFGMLGMDRLAVRFAAMRIVEADHAGLRQVLRSCVGITSISTGLLCVALFFFGERLFDDVLRTPGLTPYLGVIIAWLFCAAIQVQLTECFRGLNDIRGASLFGGVKSNGILIALSVCGLAAAFLLAGELTLDSAYWINFAASTAIVLIALILLVRRLRRDFPPAADAPPNAQPWNVGQALREGRLYWLSAVVVTLQLQGAAWLAGRMDSASHVALFAVSQRMVLFLVAPMIISNAVLPPIVAQLHTANQLKRLERVIRAISGIILLPSLMLMMVLVFGGRLILDELFGPYYVQAYPILVVLCVSQTFNIGTGAWQTVLPMTGNQRHMLVTGAIALTTQLSLGLTLGQRFGVIGVAIAVACSIMASNLSGMFFVHRSLGIWTFASLDSATFKEAAGMILARAKGRKPRLQAP